MKLKLAGYVFSFIGLLCIVVAIFAILAAQAFGASNEMVNTSVTCPSGVSVSYDVEPRNTDPSEGYWVDFRPQTFAPGYEPADVSQTYVASSQPSGTVSLPAGTETFTVQNWVTSGPYGQTQYNPQNLRTVSVSCTWTPRNVTTTTLKFDNGAVGHSVPYTQPVHTSTTVVNLKKPTPTSTYTPPSKVATAAPPATINPVSETIITPLTTTTISPALVSGPDPQVVHRHVIVRFWATAAAFLVITVAAVLLYRFSQKVQNRRT